MDDRPLRLLFVCSGNICRSPLAHVLAQVLATERGMSVEVDSGGTLGIIGQQAAKGMRQVATEHGVDLSAHRSKALTVEQIDWADRVVVMETAHALRVRQLAPHAPVPKVVPLGPYVGKPQIDDPIGSWTLGPYRVARDEIEAAMRAFMAEMASQP